MKLFEQLAPHIGRSRVKAWVKRMTNRAMCRLVKKDLDEAPVKRPTKGWWF